MIVLLAILWTMAGLLTAYSLFPGFSLFLASLRKRKQPPTGSKEKSINCIITAYKEFEITLPQIEALSKQKYQSFKAYVVADRCQPPPEIPSAPFLSVFFPEQDLNSKVLSIQYAIDRFTEEPEAILILDADNLLHPDALSHLNRYLSSGFIAVQGQRTAKNLDTPVAALDALSELYYNKIQREVAFRLGSSATIAGSGMAIESTFFRSYLDRLFREGKAFEIAEDKLLQMMLVSQGHRIAYCREALIFDEKVSGGDQVQRQRTRWIRSWFQHWKSAMSICSSGLKKGDWNQTYFGLMLSFPPMFLLVGGLALLGIVGLGVSPGLAILSGAGLLAFGFQFFLTMVLSYTPVEIWKALPKIPLFISRQILAILKIQASKKDFMATTHTENTYIDAVWESRKKDFPYLSSKELPGNPI
jgi:cellulose synthase/poly-beta-1,6-N-acetylglucosamine synthase-like glycosyltransferase